MANSSKKTIEEFLDESFEDESDISNVYDSDADPEYRPGENNTNINFIGPSQSLETSADDPSADESFSESSSDNSDDEPVDNSNLWVNNYLDIPDFGFNSDSIGIKLEINESARNNPIEIFKQIWTDEITEIFVSSINKYGENMSLQCRPHNKGSRNTHFKRTTSEEVQHFLAVCLLGGSIQFSVVRDMFSNNPLYYHPIAGHIMSGRRFEKLCRCFSVEYANDTNPLVGPMKKLYPVFDMLIQNFQKSYFPDENLSLDESLLLHRGRLVWRQYIKGKKAKYGIKFYELCTHDGYVLNVDMYKGKQTSSAVEEGVSKVDNIVLTLMKPLLNKGHSLYMDNFYNSVTLSNILLEKKTHTTGTLRSNRRGNPKEVTTKKLKRGDHIWRRNKNVYVSKWKDKRDVLCLTTKSHPKIIPSKNKYGILKNKPAEIVDYNNCMSGIDCSDQMVSYYSSPRKSARWYKKVLYHMLDITTWNSYFIYKKHFNTNLSFKQFRDLLIKNVIGLPIQTTATDLFKIKKTTIQAPENNHYAEKIPVPKNYKRQTYFKNCIQCYKTKIRKQTSFQCKVCGKPLCPGKCFEEWHNRNQ